ncbi:MAG: 2-oxo acid dehydrogenase subunit E2 [Actinobacteria bacterium]|nr:2-oxo acid dehydrogenase subunit E2 [Actinomycetota bacterium]
MPRLSDSMEEGTILRWLVADGAEVERDEEIAEIETDKATMAFEAPVAGRLRIIVAAEESVGVGELIARIGEEVGDEEAVAGADEKPGAIPRTAAPAPSSAGSRVSPVARRLAAELGIDLEGVVGSGPGGRILKEDVAAVAAASAPPAPATTARGGTRRERPSRAQALVARRMAEASATVPAFPVTVEVAIGAVAELRRQLKAAWDPAPTVNDVIVAAVARTLRSHPRLNAAWVDGGFIFYGEVNIGVAVEAGDELVVPVLAGADRLPLATLAARSRDLVERTRSGAITPPELAGGTFTISNLGMFGISWFQPIVNPPQAAILGVGGISTGHEGRAAISLTLASDHRVVYGAHAARFLDDLRRLLESPLPLVASDEPRDG